MDRVILNFEAEQAHSNPKFETVTLLARVSLMDYSQVVLYVIRFTNNPVMKEKSITNTM